MEDILNQLASVKKAIEGLLSKRIYQDDIVPGAVKMRHMGEANMYIMAGLEDDLPAGNTVTSSTTAYFATDTNKLYIWNGTAWKSTTLT